MTINDKITDMKMEVVWGHRGGGGGGGGDEMKLWVKKS